LKWRLLPTAEKKEVTDFCEVNVIVFVYLTCRYAQALVCYFETNSKMFNVSVNIRHDSIPLLRLKMVVLAVENSHKAQAPQ